MHIMFRHGDVMTVSKVSNSFLCVCLVVFFFGVIVYIKSVVATVVDDDCQASASAPPSEGSPSRYSAFKRSNRRNTQVSRRNKLV